MAPLRLAPARYLVGYMSESIQVISPQVYLHYGEVLISGSWRCVHQEKVEPTPVNIAQQLFYQTWNHAKASHFG